MGTTLALVGGLFALVGIALWVALAETRRRARAELEAGNAADALNAREGLDQVLAQRIGRRRKLLAWLRAREADRGPKP